LGNPGIETAGNERRSAEEPDGESGERDADEEEEFTKARMASWSENKEDVGDIIEQHGKREGEEVAENGMAFLERGSDAALDEVIVRREKGVGKPGESPHLHQRSDDAERAIFRELEGYRRFAGFEPSEGFARTAVLPGLPRES